MKRMKLNPLIVVGNLDKIGNPPGCNNLNVGKIES